MRKQCKLYLLISLFLCYHLSNSQTDSIAVIKHISLSEDFLQSNPDSSISNGFYAYQIAQKLKSNYLITKATINLGVIYQETADYKKSTSFFVDGIAMAEKLGDKKIMCQAYNSFGNLFSIQRQFSQASEYYSKAIQLAKELQDTLKTAVILTNLANIEYNISYIKKDFSSANQAYEQALLWSVLSKDTSIQISTLSNWGMSLSDEEKYSESLEKLNQALTLAQLAKHQSDLIFIYHYIGRTYSFMKEHQKAIINFKASLSLAEKFKDLEYETENYYYLAISNYALEKYKEAFDLFEIHKNLNDTLSNKEITNELNAIKVKYDTEKKQQEIELLKTNANKDKIVKTSLLAGALMLLLFAFLLFNRYRLKTKTNELLEKQNQIITEKNKDISDSINYAKKIQEAILPNTEELNHIFQNHFVLSMPKDVVSGDFYWAAEINEIKLFAVADCTGHGIPGAFMSMIGNTLLNQIIIERQITQPNEILNQLRKEIILALKQNDASKNKDGMDISLISFNSKTKLLQVACANNPVWIITKNKQLIEIKPDKQPIGYATNSPKDFTLQEFELNDGDTIYQFTDGYADQFGGDKGKKYKYNQLKTTLLTIHDKALIEQNECLRANFLNWKLNLEQIDDVLVTGIRI